MLARRPILLTNIATVLVGMGLYFAFLGLTGFVEAPVRSGYGFGATVLAASVVFLLPGAFAGFLTSLASGRYIDRFGARAVLIAETAAGAAGFVLLATAHSAPRQVIAAGCWPTPHISLAYGRCPPWWSGGGPARPGSRTSMNHRPHDRQFDRSPRSPCSPAAAQTITPESSYTHLRTRCGNRRPGDGVIAGTSPRAAADRIEH